MRLPDLQREFFRAIAGADHEATRGFSPSLTPEIRSDDRLGAAERIGVYARMYCVRLSDALAEDYPRVAAMLGREAFTTVAHDYVTRHPSTHPSLRWFGRGFAAFLAERNDAAFPPFLPDLARLEWARLAVFDAGDAESLALEALRRLPPESWASLRLALGPAVEIIQVAWPVHRIWENGESPTDRVDWQGEDTWLRVWRQGDKVYQASMDLAERTALGHVQAGRDFAAVCDGLAAVVPAAEAARTAGALVLRWIEDGVPPSLTSDVRAPFATLILIVEMALVGCDRHSESPLAESDPLPAATTRPPELVARLRAAVAQEGTAGPRTRHRRPDGTARYTNRLILERSPYLRQHAHNPVDWYPWGDEAFTRARAEGKPILLSIGYATCHWCHVMEEESFEDEGIAARLNTDYVSIKVDREERPDVDATFLQAVSLLTGGAGWPMTVWMTPAREIFFAGTYFPPHDGDRGARMGFLTLLERLAVRVREDPVSVAAEGRALTARLQALADVDPAPEAPGRAVLDAAFARYRATFDEANGGFGRAPKFPMPAALEFLLRYHRRTGEPAALMMVQRTLEHLADGGVRDQLGGGFHRYATDPAWRIPHFEKMLYDNAQLTSVYLAAEQATGHVRFAEIAREIIEDLLRTLRAPEGAFYAAIDADDPVGEGAFYTWTPTEIDGVLADQQAVAVRTFYGVDTIGNLGGRTVLHVARAGTEVAETLAMDPPRFTALVAEGRRGLLSARVSRPPPLVDTKILAGWNGLAISALARAGAVLDEPGYVRVAREAADFILARMQPDGRLQRVYAAGIAGQAAFLEDYAFLTAAFLDLYEATFELRWLQEAERMQRTLIDEFWDARDGAFFASGADRDPRLPRPKPADDGALPSGNAVAAENLLRLATLDDDDGARRRAAECVRALGRGLAAAPTSAPRLLGVVEALLDRSREIVVVEPRDGAGTASPLLRVVQDHYLPNRALVVAREGAALAAVRDRLAFVGEKHALEGRATAYVCERGNCLLPTSEPDVLRRQLANVHPLPAVDRTGD